MMYDIPSRDDTAEVRITPELVRGDGEPVYVLKQKDAPAQLSEGA